MSDDGNNDVGHFPPKDYGVEHRAAWIRTQKRYAVGCPKCGRKNESSHRPSAKRPVECTGCGLMLLPTE